MLPAGKEFMAERRKLSAYIIAYNEEKKIEDCLKSIKWADEIIVVDCFSTDQTREICRRYTDKIYQAKFTGFGQLRNLALSYTSYDWILNLDADERIPLPLQNELVRELSLPQPSADVYLIPRKSYFLGKWIKHCGWYPDYRHSPFFYKPKLKYRSDDLVHEWFETSGKIGYLKNSLIHYPFMTLEEFFQKMDRYSGLKAKEMFQKGKKFHLSHLLIHPLACFCRMYFTKLGFLDGQFGFILSILYSYYTFIKYLKLWELSGWQRD